MEVFKGRICHIYNRGNRKDLICFDKDDYDSLLNLINRSFNSLYFDVISVCIMPNHYHLLVSQIHNKPIWQSMHRIGTLHAKYINKKYGLTGHLFEDSYKCKEIKDCTYFKKIVNYIRDNPNELKDRADVSFRLQENKFLQDYYIIHLSSIDD
ncbi:TPA: hypothetical protein GX533_03685 [Candidatus Dojkabacteria bacterium]|uniref:Transposase IS200-like domain-containing protein n=1 Tax=Candidatus Dojkabacteria bacterium TaxID=2099670 RepID=A0A832QCW4_9BACT|nr:hypothetical protein [Candidatus Dojkabacteria bacterium]